MGVKGLKKAFLLFSACILLTLGLSGCANTPTTHPLAEPSSPSVAAPQAVQRVTLEESKAAFDSGAAVFLDVRSASSYATGHIPGALSIPLGELEARIGELDPDQWIITYCT